jgi:hypothetical protein
MIVEKQNRELMGNIERTRQQQDEIEREIYDRNPQLWKKGEDFALKHILKNLLKKPMMKTFNYLTISTGALIICNTLSEKQAKRHNTGTTYQK